MAWIKTIEEQQAEGDLKRIYAEQRQQAGDLANILKIHSLAPSVLKAHLGFIRQPCTHLGNSAVNIER